MSSIDEFLNKYTLIDNPFSNEGQYEGKAFDLSEEEMEFVLEYEKDRPGQVWTIIEGDGNGVAESDEVSVFHEIILNGIHYVNRSGYLLTEEAGEENERYEELETF